MCTIFVLFCSAIFLSVPGMSFWGHSEKLEIFTGARWDRAGMCCPFISARLPEEGAGSGRQWKRAEKRI